MRFDIPQKPSETPFWSPPNEARCKALRDAGTPWARYIVPLRYENMVVLEHMFQPLETQGLYVGRDGTSSARKFQRVVCPGSYDRPWTGDQPWPYSGGMPNREGERACANIKLGPEGPFLHEHTASEEYDAPARSEYRIYMPVCFLRPRGPQVDCEEQEYYVFARGIRDPFTRDLLNTIAAAVTQQQLKPGAWYVRVVPHWEGNSRKGWHFEEPTALTTPLPATPTEKTGDRQSRWERIRAALNPLLTPEAIVQYLGVERYNSQHTAAAQSAMPAQTIPAGGPTQVQPPGPQDFDFDSPGGTNPQQLPHAAPVFGGTDDPWGDPAPIREV